MVKKNMNREKRKKIPNNIYTNVKKGGYE